MIRLVFKLSNRQTCTLYPLYQYGVFSRQQEQLPLHKKKKVTQQKKDTLDDVKFNQKGIEKINAANQHFQGIRMNTSYAKFYNEDSFSKIDTFTGSKISDLPFQPKDSIFKAQVKVEQSQKQQKNKTKKSQQKSKQKPEDEDASLPKKTKLAKTILNSVDQKKLKEALKSLSQKYFADLINKQRNVKIQPNFERQARRAITGLKKSGYEFKMTKNQKFSLVILNAEIFRGLQVSRNNNYSIDSYQILKQQGYVYYKLWQKGSYKIPEEQWFSQRNMLMRITAEVSSPYNIEVLKNNNAEIKTEKKSHTFVFETDLKHPPKFSQFRMSPLQYLKSYTIDLNNIVITNVDNRNPYAAFTYEQKDKKQKLINKLV